MSQHSNITHNAVQSEADFLLSSYQYELPHSAIAQNPSNPRENAKLLVYERKNGHITHSTFHHFNDFVPKDALIVLNDTKVIKARIYAHKINAATHKPNARTMEIFFHKALDSHNVLVQIKGRVKCGDTLLLKIPHSKIYAHVKMCLDNGMRIVHFTRDSILLEQSQVLALYEKYGHIPLPPYIKRDDSALDALFYQSIFAQNLGSVAAPTASLHFSQQSLESLKKHFNVCFITLHVGAGTFTNVDSTDIRLHKIHSESYTLSKASAKKIIESEKVLCIGTTSARCVEYYMRHRRLSGECDIFLYPGVAFKRVDFLLTNFHLPKSTLLMLVSAMIGREKCLELYHLAIKEGYRFYSYGDGMLIL